MRQPEEIVAESVLKEMRRQTVLERDRPSHKTEYKITQDARTAGYNVHRSELMSVLGATPEEDHTKLTWVPMRKLTMQVGYYTNTEVIEFDTLEEAEEYVYRLANPIVRYYDDEGSLTKEEYTTDK